MNVAALLYKISRNIINLFKDKTKRIKSYFWHFMISLVSCKHCQMETCCRTLLLAVAMRKLI